MTAKSWIVEVEDSDGYDSTQEVWARDEKTARQLARQQHFVQSGYRSCGDERAPAILRTEVHG